MDSNEELLGEFLQESWEGLNQLDQDFVVLESDPSDRERLAGIFRCIHTIKGAAGFLALKRLETVAHAGESLLSRLRNGDMLLDAVMTSSLLAMVDAIRAILTDLDANGTEGSEGYDALIAQLAELSASGSVGAASPGEATPLPTAATSAAPVAPAVPAAAPAAAAATPTPTPSPVAAAPNDGDHPTTAVAEAIESAPAKGPGVSDAAIRVDVGLLDRVMNLVGELVLARNQILQFGGSVKDQGFLNASQRLNLLTTELQEGVMKTRMQPIGSVWNKFPRVVRDLAQALDKKVKLDLDGADTELDRTIIEAIKDPLTHLVRNAVDHGLEKPDARRAAGKNETGRLLLRAFHEGGQVNIEITDDGAGINPRRLRTRAIERGIVTADRASRMSDREAVFLIFEPGFSTTEQITKVSGRGVGMDVVKTNIERIGGTVDIQTEVGVGTTLKIKIPLTLAIIPALIVDTGDNRFAIPQVSLLELVRLEGGADQPAIESMMGTNVYRLRGNLLPLVFLDEALEIKRRSSHREPINIVVLQADDRQFGLVVDNIHDTEEIVVKPLGKELKGLSCFAGATIMGDGRVALILDIPGIAQKTGVMGSTRERALVERPVASTDVETGREAYLLFRLGQRNRMAMPLSMVARLEELSVASVETASGRSVVQYRGAIMPLVDIREAMQIEPAPANPECLQVIVHSQNGRSVGLVVDQILDTVEEVTLVTRAGARDGVLGAAVIQGKVTDILDAPGMVGCVGEDLALQETP